MAPVAPQPARHATASIEHTHKTRGTFFSGFGMTCGCLAAVGVATIGGCAAFVIFAGSAVNSTTKVMAEAAKEVEARRVSETELLAPHLVGVKVLSASLEPPGQYEYSNRILITIRNDNDHVIQTVDFIGVLQTPGRELPWAEGLIRYSIPGGLEPGESKELRLEPNIMSDFRSIEIPDDAVFSVDVVDVEWPSRNADLGLE
ncbi:hypothetical protein KOR34_04790 [Posidoniimonas corsicana]|uniref:Uncharacterized protein n=1 Tax=Posidoniimonas corsicana TaxID=1938618 RepID=A0A5C5VAG3_9BACT|nr:hypothetical protein [Posidoniimonas corsicana]TWT35586.1 hypothetical protein KOR34_04790 [Posidoniimonas corsicana]